MLVLVLGVAGRLELDVGVLDVEVGVDRALELVEHGSEVSVVEAGLVDDDVGGGGGPMSFTFDGQEFDADRIDQQVRLNTVEEWTVGNDSPLDHPFHLHVWPMQLLEVDGQKVSEPLWLDVVNVPARSQVKVRVVFEDFGGKTVYHCHILDHEDRGMMATVLAR